MRSRYAAYALGNADYLLATWHPRTRPPRLDLEEEPVPRWLGLAVKDRQAQGPEEARVEFLASYKIGGRAHHLHETSRFLKENGRWYYVDGDLHES